MKIFISGEISESKSIRKLFDLMEENGHEITHDWTSTDTFLGSKESKIANLDESAKRAYKDIQGVLDCDVYILSSDNKNVGKGMYVELGAALALSQGKLLNNPKVYVIGQLNHLSMFYLHPSVNRRKDIHEVLTELSSSTS